MPIANVNELTTGQQYPPERVRYRHDNFERWYRWSQGHWVGLGAKYVGYQGVTTGAITSVNRQRGFDAADTSDNPQGWPRLTDNIFEFLMHFWEDAVLEDSPVITGQANEQPTIDALMRTLMPAARVVVGDLIRYGVGCFVNRQAGNIQAIDPRFWFPVRPPWDLTQAMGDTDILAWPYASEMPSDLDGLVIETYTPGMIERRFHALESRTIGNQTSETQTLPGAAMHGVIPVRSDDCEFYGQSDFDNSAQFVQEIHRRESSVSTALDRHANPHLQIPEAAVARNADGSISVDIDGMVIPMPDGADRDAQYVVWDAKFQYHESAIQRATQSILRGSRIAPILVNAEMDTPQLASGAALRRLAIPTVARIKDIRYRLECAMRYAIEGAVSLMAASGQPAVMVDVDNLMFEWPVPLSSADEDLADAVDNTETEPAAAA